MQDNSLKRLNKLIQLCRKSGVTEIEFEGIKLKLEALSQNRTSKAYKRTPIADNFDPGPVPQPMDIIPGDGPTEEQLLFGSADPSVWETKPQ